MSNLPTAVVPELGRGTRISRIAELAAASPRVDIRGARGGAFAAAIAEVLGGRSCAGRWRRFVAVTEDEASAVALADDLAYLLPATGVARRSEVLPYPDWEQGPYDELVPERSAQLRRSATLFAMSMGSDWRVAVFSAGALLRRVTPRSPFERACLPVASGERVEREDLLDALERGGYHRTPLVEEPGTFAVRGSVIDVFPPYLEQPARIETFGDEVERIRCFATESQATGDDLEEIWIHPVRLALLPRGTDERDRAAARVRAVCDEVDHPTSRTDRTIADLLEGRLFVGSDGLAPAFYDRLDPVGAYFPNDTACAIDNPAGMRLAQARLSTAIAADHRRCAESGRPAFPVESHLARPEEIGDELGGRPLLISHPLSVSGEASEEHPLERGDDAVDLGAVETSNLAERLRVLSPGDEDPFGATARYLAALVDEGYRVSLVARSAGHADRLAEMARGRGLEVRGAEPGGLPRVPSVSVETGPLARGCLLPADGKAFITEEEIFGRRAHRRRGARRGRVSLDDLRLLRVGDLVVHVEHGVGRYRGLVRQRVESAAIDCLSIEYRDGDRLYLPVYRLNQVQKFQSGGEERVRLDKLGGQTFARKKELVRRETAEIAAKLLDLYSRRASASRPPVEPADNLYRAFEAAFPFEETDDQARAIEEVESDLERERPMDRLVCGDVGFGKTEVAMRAAFRALMSGRQVAVLVPTTVLAQQHYQSFRQRFSEYPVRVEMLSRFRTQSENRRVAYGLKQGQVDVVVGTHRLLSRDVHFKRLGLLVVDEEHRFGVAHKERIRQLRASVDTLVLTATPIPRTLHMAFVGMRDLSLIATAPVNRRPIRTVVCHDDPTLLREAIERELARDGQVFFVHNRVRDIERVAERVRRMVPRARTAVAHGRMREEELERVMLDFVAGLYDLLVCTAIIESGLDIPRANTIIVDRADTFGLAQLYQLRGRVGRSNVQAHAYLVVPPLASLGEEARERVDALARHTELGSGFSVASLDLEIRGAGDLLGAEQSGSISAVGFEMYCDLLAEAAEDLRGEERRDEPEPELTLERPGLLEESYVPDVGQRLQLYKRLAGAEDETEVQRLAAEMVDRFGPLPEEARLLVDGMVAKALCRRIGAMGLEVAGRRITVHLGPESRVDPERVKRIVREGRGRVRVTPELKVIARFGGERTPDAAIATSFLRALGGYDNNPSIS